MELLTGRRLGVVALVVGVGLAVLLTGSTTAMADTTPQSLPFTQSWTNTGLITANDNWSGVPGVEGYLGQDITTSTSTDPQTLLTTSSVANDLDVIANQTNTAITNGGVAEFELANPTIALQGSGTADAPYILITLDTTGLSSISVSYNLRDIDGTTDNAVQPVALQYRVGASGNFTNVPAGFVADATTGPSVATFVTPVSANLPANANNQPLVQVRVITSNAVGNDEWVGVDDISVTGSVADTPPSVTIDQASGQNDPTATSPIHFTVVFSEPVTGFATGDVSLSGTAGATTAAVSEVAPHDGTTFDVAVSGMTATGTVVATVNAGVATDAGNNPNTASTSDDNTVTYNFVNDQLTALYNAVRNTKPGKALGGKVKQIQAYVAANNKAAACTGLNDFINLVKAQKGKKLTNAQAADYTAQANAIKSGLGC
jgi:hypothetical protein